MKNTRKQNIFVLTTLAAAMTGVFAAMPAYADDEERAALTQPQNSVDAEVITVGRGSPQFGQYNGLNRSGAYGNANIQFRAGDAYTNNENGGTTRVTIIGTDLGLSNRSASAKYEDQGSWSVGVGYDALTHVIGATNGYQTPYGNGVGQNTFTLPSAFGSINGAQTNGAATTALGYKAGSQYMSSGQLSQFGPQTIETTRDNYSINGAYIINPGLTASFDVNHMVQSGAKLMSFASGLGGGGTGTTAIKAQSYEYLPNPTNYQTDTVNAGVEWLSGGSRLALNYFGSFFRDGYNQVQWQGAFNNGTNVTTNPIPGSAYTATSLGMQTMSTMPSNIMNQLTLAGGYDFTDKTKMNGSFSWGRNTTGSGGTGYDQQMLATNFNVPNFNGLVNQIHGDLKVVDRSVKGLTLSATGKIDQRDNQSSSNLYQLYAVNGGDLTNYPNTPMSWRKGVIELAGDYKIDKNNSIWVGYENEQMRRWCNSYATGGNTVLGQPGYPQGTSCVTANNDSTNAVNLAYKLKASEDVSFKLSGGYSMRKVDWNQNAIAAFSGTQNSYYGAVQPIPGINGGDYLGFQPYFEASRNQAKVKGSAAWQATDRLGFNLSGQLTNDTYPDNTYGMQNGYGWSLSLDSTYNWSETGTAYMFATQQQTNRVMTNYTYSASSSTTYGTYSPSTSSMTGTWTNTQNNMTTTVGLGAKEKGLLAGKLTVAADGMLSFANTNYQTGVNPISTTSYNCSTAGPNPAATLTCGNLPSITNNLYQLKASGLYQVAKNSKLGLMYTYQHLYSTDYLYNAVQPGNTPTGMLPSMMSAPSYSVNVVQAKYIYDF